MVIGHQKGTKSCDFSESKKTLNSKQFRGGIAIVWLGKKDDRFVAMKQFPKLQGKQVDSSAYVEFHAHEIIKQNSDSNGKLSCLGFV